MRAVVTSSVTVLCACTTLTLPAASMAMAATWLRPEAISRYRIYLLAIMFAFILIFASLTEAVGLHFIIGAFFASMLLSKELLGVAHFQEFEKTTHGMAMGFLAPIFFAGIGLEFRFSSITVCNLI